MSIDSRIEENGCNECGQDAIYVEDFTADTNIIICNNEDCRSFSKEDASAKEKVYWILRSGENWYHHLTAKLLQRFWSSHLEFVQSSS